MPPFRRCLPQIADGLRFRYPRKLLSASLRSAESNRSGPMTSRLEEFEAAPEADRKTQSVAAHSDSGTGPVKSVQSQYSALEFQVGRFAGSKDCATAGRRPSTTSAKQQFAMPQEAGAAGYVISAELLCRSRTRASAFAGLAPGQKLFRIKAR